MSSQRLFISSLFIFATFFYAGRPTVQAVERQAIKLEITTQLGDMREFQEGDRISFLVSLDRDAYLLVLYRNAKGQLVQLLPNKIKKQFFLRAGMFLPIPDASTPFVFEIEKPFGRETLLVFASDMAMPVLPGHARNDGLKKLTMDIDSIRGRLKTKSKAFGEAVYSLTTRAGNKNH